MSELLLTKAEVNVVIGVLVIWNVVLSLKLYAAFKRLDQHTDSLLDIFFPRSGR